MKLLVVWGLLLALSACSSSQSSPHVATGMAMAASATRTAPVQTTVRPRIDSL